MEIHAETVVDHDNRTVLLIPVTNWDVFYDTASQLYYLLNRDVWLTTSDAINGTWSPTFDLPAGLSFLPSHDNWADVRRHVPGRLDTNPSEVFVSTEPAELILTNCKPTYNPISGTQLIRIANTDVPFFLNSGDGKYYLLVAGRWFRASTLNGPWTAASNDVPADFARIRIAILPLLLIWLRGRC